MSDTRDCYGHSYPMSVANTHGPNKAIKYDGRGTMSATNSDEYKYDGHTNNEEHSDEYKYDGRGTMSATNSDEYKYDGRGTMSATNSDEYKYDGHTNNEEQ
jgi:predicted chitinase